jgi:hypothetical protein
MIAATGEVVVAWAESLEKCFARALGESVDVYFLRWSARGSDVEKHEELSGPFPYRSVHRYLLPVPTL